MNYIYNAKVYKLKLIIFIILYVNLILIIFGNVFINISRDSMNVKGSITRFLKQCKRVLRVSKKPDREEYLNFSKITALGIAIIGAVGFVIVLISQLSGI